MKKASKYRNKKTVLDGITFDSKAEAKRYAELKLLERGKVINNLELQPKFKILGTLRVDGHRTMSVKYYIADFMYQRDGKTIVEDVKGMKTPVYQLKKQLFLSLYGDKVEFREVFNGNKNRKV